MGRVDKESSLPHRGLAARLPLQRQLVELILRLILIQGHLQQTHRSHHTHRPLLLSGAHCLEPRVTGPLETEAQP